jgi:hypothetical protein
MIRYLIYIGLAVTPFLTIQGYDSRYPKEVFALGIALLIALYGFSRGLKPFQNKWILLFIFWVGISSIFLPKFEGLNLYGGGNVDGLWSFKSMFYLLTYVLMAWVISSVRFSDNVIWIMVKIMAFSGCLMAVYAILQALGIDPLFHVRDLRKLTGQGLPPSANITGTLGQPTILAAFLVMCLPMALCVGKTWIFLTILTAIIISKSSMAFVALIGAYIYFVFPYRSKRQTFAFTIFVLFGWLAVNNGWVSDSGRFLMWEQVLQDMRANPITLLTGFGFGSFGYIFSALMHPTGIFWLQMHNEYLEVLWGCGAIGLFFIVKAIDWVLQRSQFVINEDKILYLMMSLVAICLCACGNFVWHLGVFQFYTAVMVGIVFQKIRTLTINKEISNAIC